MVKQEAQDAAFGARLFYNGIMISTIALFFVYDNDLRKAILSFDVVYFLSFFALYGLCYYLYYITGQNPGFVELSSSAEGDHIELSISKTGQNDGAESLLQPQTALSSGENIQQYNDDNSAQPQNTDDVEKSVVTRKSKKKENSWMPDLRFCEHCQINQPYRTKHCDKCERCVHKFDHHCFWMGGCIGELNHGKFWLFLFFQTILQGWAYLIASSGMDAGYDKGMKDVQSKTTGTTSPYTTTEYGAFMTIAVIIFLAFIFTGVLCGFHTFLILTNQSTWEYLKKDRISYLKIYPGSFYPFSEGVWGNIKMIFFHKNRVREWELPPVEISRRPKGFNWCENEYWSCC